MDLPEDLLYSKEHEWIRVDNGAGTVGITDFAQGQLGDVVFVELPTVGKSCQANSPMASLESVKAVSEVYCPVSGQISAVNEGLNETPEIINDDPYGKGWIVKIQLQDPAELSSLLSAGEYEKYVEEEADAV